MSNLFYELPLCVRAVNIWLHCSFVWTVRIKVWANVTRYATILLFSRLSRSIQFWLHRLARVWNQFVSMRYHIDVLIDFIDRRHIHAQSIHTHKNVFHALLLFHPCQSAIRICESKRLPFRVIVNRHFCVVLNTIRIYIFLHFFLFFES